MRINKPSISIDGVEYKCMSRTVELVPGNDLNFCEKEWTCSIELEISYGVGGSWTTLNALRDTVAEVVISPSDGTIAAGNPSATFDAVIPAIPFMSGATKTERQTFTLDLMAEAEPVFAEA
jgi:hypothetical protein